jgi:hypothetical protein
MQVQFDLHETQLNHHHNLVKLHAPIEHGLMLHPLPTIHFGFGSNMLLFLSQV